MMDDEWKNILFVSKYSQSCFSAVQACNQLGLSSIIKIIYIDSNEARELIKDAKYINLTYVPTLMINEDGNMKVYVGPKVIQYMNLLYNQIQGQMQEQLQSTGHRKRNKSSRTKKKKRPIKKVRKKPEKRVKKHSKKEESSSEEEYESSDEEKGESSSEEEEENSEEEINDDEGEIEPVAPSTVNEKGKVNIAEAMAIAAARREEDLGYSEKNLPYH